MSTVLGLFAIGVVFLALELLVPGVAMGIVGAVCFLAGTVFSFLNFGAWSGLGALALAAALGGLTLYLEFFVLPRTRAGRKFFLNSSVSGTSQPLPAEASVIGKTGEALTVLAPSGYILVEGRRYEAFSLDGMLTKGESLKVVGVDHLTLRVSKV